MDHAARVSLCLPLKHTLAHFLPPSRDRGDSDKPPPTLVECNMTHGTEWLESCFGPRSRFDDVATALAGQLPL